jgi:hypothetical protein
VSAPSIIVPVSEPVLSIDRQTALRDTQEVDVDAFEEDWLMAATNTGDRIEAKLDRLVSSFNEMHRELGAILARDAEYEKRFSEFRESTHGSRDELDRDVDKVENQLDTLQREFDAKTGALGAQVKILLWVAGGLGTAVFGLLVHLVANLTAG